MYYFYVLKNQKSELYYGSTNDLKRRVAEHNAGKSYSTRGSIWQLVYYEAYLSEKDARRRESQIKNHGQAKRWLKDRISDTLLKQS